MKNINRLVSLVVAVSMLLCFGATFAWAHETEPVYTAAELYAPTENARYSALGKSVPENLSRDLSKMNISISDTSLVEVIPLEAEGNAEILVVTNAYRDSAVRNYIVAIDEKGETAPILNTGTGMRSSTGDNGSFRPLNDTMKITFAVQFDGYRTNGKYLYRPKSALFIFYDDDGLHTNSSGQLNGSIRLVYTTYGFEHSYPAMQDLGGGFYTHTITVSQTSPNARTYYSRTNAYSSSRVISTNNGCHQVQVYYTIDGVSSSYLLDMAQSADW